IISEHMNSHTNFHYYSPHTLNKVSNQSFILCLMDQWFSMLLRISFFNVCENSFDFKLLILLINSLGLLELRIKCLALGCSQFLIMPILVPKMGIPHA